MKTKQLLSFILIFLSFMTACDIIGKTQNKEDYVFSKKETVINDRDQLKLFCDSITEFWTPTKEQIKIVESIIENAIKNNTEVYWEILNVKTAKKYYRQYSFYKDQKGELIVFINAFCEIYETPIESSWNSTMKPFDWKYNFMIVLDGGDCFWSIKINLTKQNYFDFMVNGVA